MTSVNTKKALTFQEILFTLQNFWARHGCVLQQPYDLEVGAGTMSPDTFLRVLGPKPINIAYAQPSRRPADGRYGENPNRLFRHTQLQVILKPPPERVQELYLQSLEAIGINLAEHDIKFEEDNWEWPVGGAWGVGWQVMLDGQEITQFTYFQQCGGMDLDPIAGEITYGLERIAQFLQDLDSIYDIVWSRDPVTGAALTYGDVRLHEEQQFSAYAFDYADVDKLWQHLNLYEEECKALLERAKATLVEEGDALAILRFPTMGAYELALKCSHTFNLLDARGAISVTERVGVMARIRTLIVGVLRRDPQYDLLGEARQVRGAYRGRGQGFEHKVPGGYAVQGVGGRTRESQGAGGRLPIDGKGGAGQGGGAQGAFVHARAGVVEAAGVTTEHFDIGHQVVTEGDRLRRLQMGEARHRVRGVGLRLCDQGALQIPQSETRAIAGRPRPQADIESNLIVARPGGVEAPGGGTDQGSQPRLDIHVDVFEIVAKREHPIGDLRLDEVQPALDGLLILERDDALGRQHGGMCAGAGEVLGGQPLVEADGGVDGAHHFAGLGGEAPAP